jgi:hypothetical protein
MIDGERVFVCIIMKRECARQASKQEKWNDMQMHKKKLNLRECVNLRADVCASAALGFQGRLFRAANVRRAR